MPKQMNRNNKYFALLPLIFTKYTFMEMCNKYGCPMMQKAYKQNVLLLCMQFLKL